MLLSHGLRASVAPFVTFQASVTSTASTITAPSSVVRGNLLVLFDLAFNGDGAGSVTSVVPSGFTEVFNLVSLTTRRTIASYKIADGTEANTNITGMNGASSNFKILLVFSTVNAVSASAFDIATETTSGDPVAQTINAQNQPTPLVCFAFMRQATVTGQSFSPTQDGSVTNSALTAYYKIYNANPQNVTVDCGDGGAINILASFYIQVS